MVNTVRDIYATDSLKTASKKAIQKRVEATSYLIGSKITDIISKVSKISRRYNSEKLQMSIIKKYLKRDIYFQKKNRKLLII